MPITIKEFKNNKFDDYLVGCKNKVLEFLKKNKDKAFRPTEIAFGIYKDKSKVANITSRLKELRIEKKVFYKKPYYAFKSD